MFQGIKHIRTYDGNGAIVVGPITIGDNVVIGANSYLDKDVKSGTKIIGPASRIIE